jgi:hypothetical protein
MTVRRPSRRAIRVNPTLVIAAIALIGSGIFLLYAFTIRSKDQVPLLITGAVVLGIVFAVLAVAGAIGAYRTATQNRTGAALVNALGGGVAAVIACGLFAFAIVMGLVWSGPSVS